MGLAAGAYQRGHAPALLRPGGTAPRVLAQRPGDGTGIGLPPAAPAGCLPGKQASSCPGRCRRPGFPAGGHRIPWQSPVRPAPLRHFCDVFAIQAFLLDFYSYLCHRKQAVELTAMSRKEFPCHPTVPSLPVSRYLSRHADRLPCVHLPAGSASPARRSHVPYLHLPAVCPPARPRP